MNPDHTKHSSEKYSYETSWSEQDAAFIARVQEFPSLAAHGESPEQALGELRSLVAFVLEELREEGSPIPIPLSLRDYSGRFNVRIPPELHRALVLDATRANMSLNSYVLYKLSS